jgi:L-rhamnose isomerase
VSIKNFAQKISACRRWFKTGFFAGASRGVRWDSDHVVTLDDPTSAILEDSRDFTARLSLMEDAKSLPWGLVWQEYCGRHERPSDGGWLAKVQADEKARLSARR